MADACYYYGDHVPNFAQLKRTDPARVLPGYDYDVVTEEVMLTRMSVRDGALVLPDGMSYRVLVLPDRPGISLPVLRKLKALVKAGATVIGPKPSQTYWLTGYPKCDAAVARLGGRAVGGDARARATRMRQRSVGKGRVISGQTAREVLAGGRGDARFRIQPAVRQPRPGDAQPPSVLDYIHRADWRDATFIRGQPVQPLGGGGLHIPRGRQGAGALGPGERASAASASVYTRQEAEPRCRSVCALRLAVCRLPQAVACSPRGHGAAQFPDSNPRTGNHRPLDGPVRSRSGAGRSRRLIRCSCQTGRSGRRRHQVLLGHSDLRKSFDLPESCAAAGQRLVLDLGEVRELAEVRLNGKNLGIFWAVPFRVDITERSSPGATSWRSRS